LREKKDRTFHVEGIAGTKMWIERDHAPLESTWQKLELSIELVARRPNGPELYMCR
jgi:hypothetical protein